MINFVLLVLRMSGSGSFKPKKYPSFSVSLAFLESKDVNYNDNYGKYLKTDFVLS